MALSGSGHMASKIMSAHSLLDISFLYRANHIAKQGYVVLLPDLFYRFGAYGPYAPKEVLNGDVRAVIGPMMATTDNHKAAEDTGAFLAYLDTRDDVAGDKVGTVGFCMGGGMALTAAGYYPDRIGAAVSIHGGNLATDLPTSPTSPHLVSIFSTLSNCLTKMTPLKPIILRCSGISIAIKFTEELSCGA